MHRSLHKGLNLSLVTTFLLLIIAGLALSPMVVSNPFVPQVDASIKSPVTSGGRCINHAGQSQEVAQEEDGKKKQVIFESAIPSDLKLLEIKNARGAEWFEKFTLVFRNVSNKPIYYIRVWLLLPEVSVNPWVGFELEYGNRKLADFELLATDTDESIKSGEVFSLAVPTRQKTNMTKVFAERYWSFDVDKILAHVEVLSFGDGTGWWGGARRQKKPRQ